MSFTTKQELLASLFKIAVSRFALLSWLTLLRNAGLFIPVDRLGEWINEFSSIHKKMDVLVKDMVLSTDAKTKQGQIRDMAYSNGLFFATIQILYDEMGKNYRGFTVPAMNIRGITYDVARSAFRAAMKDRVGPFVFEIARSEMEYTYSI